MFRLSLLWSLCLGLAPLLVAQGLWARAKIPRLPEGRQPNRGSFGDAGGSSIGVTGIGDSVIAGVGCDDLSESITASVARVLHERDTLCVRWSAWGCNGDRVKDVIEKVASVPAEKTSLVIVSVGVNDVTGLTPLARWQLEVAALIGALTDRFRAPILILGVPPMAQFTGLPQPLRFALGVRAKMLDRALKRAADVVPGVYWTATGGMFEAELLAADGYHPSAAACAVWARRIADAIERRNMLAV